jgi:hypothetical protein
MGTHWDDVDKLRASRALLEVIFKKYATQHIDVENAYM